MKHPLYRLKAPTRNEFIHLTHTIAHRVARYLERQGMLEHDAGNIYLTPEALDASVTWKPGGKNSSMESAVSSIVVIGYANFAKTEFLSLLSNPMD